MAHGFLRRQYIAALRGFPTRVDYLLLPMV